MAIPKRPATPRVENWNIEHPEEGWESLPKMMQLRIECDRRQADPRSSAVEVLLTPRDAHELVVCQSLTVGYR